MRDLENMLQGLGEKNKKAEQEGITMTDLEKKIGRKKSMKIETKRIEDGEQPEKQLRP